MQVHVRLIALAVVCLAAAACNKQDAAPAAETAAPAAEATAPVQAPVEAAPATTEATPSPETATPVAGAVGEPIGVAECDDFLGKYEACVNQHITDAASRGAFEASMTQWRDTWRGLAKEESTRASLAQVCVQAKEQTKASMSAYGCTDW
jgi:hypothetical protein